MELVDKIKVVEEFFDVKIPTSKSRGETHLGSGAGELFVDLLTEKLHLLGYEGALFREEKKFVIWGKRGRLLSTMSSEHKTQKNLHTLDFIYNFVIEANKEDLEINGRKRT